MLKTQSAKAAQSSAGSKELRGQRLQVSALSQQTVDAFHREDVQGFESDLLASLSMAEHDLEVRHIYAYVLGGFAAMLSPQGLAALKDHPDVAYIEEDTTWSLSLPEPKTESPQPTPAWGLDRIDQRELPLDGRYLYKTTGKGVTVFVIDSGIDQRHAEFEGRVQAGFSVFDSEDGGDCDGHGTHVAGIVGGTLYGVAKDVTLVPVRVLDCTGSGSFSGVIAGVNWVAKQNNSPAVANMSLGGVPSERTQAKARALEQAITDAIEAGTPFVLAAGNEAIDACQVSPARLSPALTVGATTVQDARAEFSNTGACLDLFAPGEDIVSADFSSGSGARVQSGTSAAAPHVTGAAALFLETKPDASVAEVSAYLQTGASKDKLADVPSDSPNALLYTSNSHDPSLPACTIPWPELGLGSDPGKLVRVTQYLLQTHGYELSVDGSFGYLTEAQVKAFQAAKGLSVTGRVAAETWLELSVPVEKFDGYVIHGRGHLQPAVRAVQLLLGLEPTGFFGSYSETRLKHFQTRYGLDATGVADEDTWATLLSGTNCP